MNFNVQVCICLMYSSKSTEICMHKILLLKPFYYSLTVHLNPNYFKKQKFLNGYHKSQRKYFKSRVFPILNFSLLTVKI